MNIVRVESPNVSIRAVDRVDMMILHYTGMRTGPDALRRLCDPAAGVSAHWLIEEDGSVFQLVDEAQRAHHAGVSYWAGTTDINSCSVGIEIVNPGHEWGYRPFPAPQMQALAALTAGIIARHPIPPERVLGHSDVAPRRKRDPGELFDWSWLAGQGIGLWPQTKAAPTALAADEPDSASMLAGIGYDPDPAARQDVITAFQRHWCRHRCDGETRRTDPEPDSRGGRGVSGGEMDRGRLTSAGRPSHGAPRSDGWMAAAEIRGGKSGLHGRHGAG